ncbi:hypothetical protein [Paenibacillus sp. Marseille-Q4541]|uniref:hypothetical protein n=1 Tax=Paenibacillus sp. Marseille-Q4541 TaxID=2831522 RepID=UPI001BA8EBAC|nr:hypothetical protein [Paenibacillus sp. Marseille-Q4541]
MPNYNIFGNADKPLSQLQLNTYQSPSASAPAEASASQAGRLFAAGATNSASLGLLGGSIIITVQLTNPAGSERTAYISRISGGINISLNLLSSFSGSMSIVRNGTLTTPTTLTSANLNFSSSTTSLMAVRSSTSVSTGGTSVLTMPLAAGPLEFNEFGDFIIPSGQSFTLTISGALTVAGVIANTANIVWWEV